LIGALPLPVGSLVLFPAALTPAALFDNPRRSTARLQLSLIHSHGLLTPDEVKRFSSETQQMISALADTRT
jgi:hypothetical protein